MNMDENDIPALQAPSGYTSSLENPAKDGSLKATIIGTLAVCMLVTTASAILRTFAQCYLFKRLAWADLWIWLAWASHIAFCAMLLAPLPYGAGYHQWNVRRSDYHQFEFYLYVSFVLYDLAIAGAKVSILVQLSSLFAGNRRNRFYWASLSLSLINLIFYIAISFALVFQCTPIAKAWNPTLIGNCLNQDALLTSSGPFNIASDFLIFLLPIWAIWRLQLPLRRRLEVISAFAVGLFGCLCSAVRVAYSNRLARSGDGTWTLMQNQLWANAEITAGILIASIFILPRFLRHLRGHGGLYPYSTHTGRYTSDNTYADGTLKSNRGTWNGAHNAAQNNRFSRDPYIELAESRDCDDLSLSHDPKDFASRERSAQRESVINRVSEPSIESRSSGGHGIVKTIEIETTEEHVMPTAPRPVAVPGMAI